MRRLDEIKKRLRDAGESRGEGDQNFVVLGEILRFDQLRSHISVVDELEHVGVELWPLGRRRKKG